MNQAKADLFKPVTPKRASDSISNQIKELIYSGALKPEDRLPSERDLAVTFKTGRMTVREALRMLEESGFICVRQGADGGTFVKELDGSGMTKTISGLVKVGNITLAELTEARVAIETILLESLITDITDEQLSLLQKNIDNCEPFSNKAIFDMRKTGRQLINFHLLLASFSKNGLLRYFLQSMVELSTTFIHQYAPHYVNSTDHLSHHRAIYEAIKARDLTRSHEALKNHLYAVARNVDTVMRGEKKHTF